MILRSQGRSLVHKAETVRTMGNGGLRSRSDSVHTFPWSLSAVYSLVLSLIKKYPFLFEVSHCSRSVVSKYAIHPST